MVRKGNPCVIKSGNNRVREQLPELKQAVLDYAATRTIVTDHVRHGAEGTRKRNESNKGSVSLATDEAASENTDDEDTDDVTALPYSEEDGGDGTLEIKGCIIGHRAFVPRMGKKKHDIELEQGPAETYVKKVAGKALRTFAAKLLPLTRTVEALFRGVLPDEYKKYKAVYDEIYEEDERDPIDEAFGIWTSRSLVMNANTRIWRMFVGGGVRL